MGIILSLITLDNNVPHATPNRTYYSYGGGAGAGIDYQDLTRQGCRGRDHRDVLVACPGGQYPPQRPPVKAKAGNY